MRLRTYYYYITLACPIKKHIQKKIELTIVLSKVLSDYQKQNPPKSHFNVSQQHTEEIPK